MTRRALLRYVRTPQLIVMATVQMTMFFLIYRYLFGGAIHIAGMPYVDYLVPGLHRHRRAVQRHRRGGGDRRGPAARVHRPAALAADPAQQRARRAGHRRHGDPRAGRAVTVGIAFAVGFRLHGSALDGLAAFGLVILFGFAFEWLFVTMGLFAGNAQAAQGMGMIVFPFAFISSAYIPVATMPGWLQVFAAHQPLTYMVDAVRALTLGPHAQALLGHPAGYFVTRALDLDRWRSSPSHCRWRWPSTAAAEPSTAARARTRGQPRVRARSAPRARSVKRGAT